MNAAVKNGFQFPGFSLFSSESKGSIGVITGQFFGSGADVTVTLIRTSGSGNYVVRQVVSGNRTIWDAEAHRRAYIGDVGHLVPTPFGPAVALMNQGRVIGIRFVGVEASFFNSNTEACVGGKNAAAEYLGCAAWFNKAEQAFIGQVNHHPQQQEQNKEQERLAEETAKEAVRAREKAAEARRAALEMQQADADRKRIEKEERRRAFEAGLLSRSTVTGVMMGGDFRYGTPVLASEVDRVPAGMCVIVVRDLQRAAATVEEYCKVERTSGGRVVRNFRTAVEPVLASSPRPAAGKSAVQATRHEVKPIGRVLVVPAEDMQLDVALYGSEQDIRTLCERGDLLPDTYVATPPEKDGDTRVMVYRVLAKGRETIGPRYPI